MQAYVHLIHVEVHAFGEQGTKGMDMCVYSCGDCLVELMPRKHGLELRGLYLIVSF